MKLVATLRSLAALADADARAPALDALARQIDACTVLLFAPSNPPPIWRELAARCASPGVHTLTTTDPATSRSTSVVAYTHPGVSLVAVGHTHPNAELADAIALVAPLLAALLHAEQEAQAARHQVVAQLGQQLQDPIAPIATALQMLRFEGAHTRTHEILERQLARLMRVVDDLYADARTPEHASEREASPTAGSVLVVDDNCDAADLLGALLESLGFAVRIAHTGDDGLAVLDHFTPDIALLDIGLPGMDGYELAGEVHKRLPALPLIAVTGYGQDKDRARALAAGFSAHLVKPVSIACLSQILDKLVGPVTLRGDGKEPLPRPPT